MKTMIFNLGWILVYLMRGAADACQQQGVTFLSMALESFGGWHEASVKEVGRLGAALTRQLTSQGRRRKRP